MKRIINILIGSVLVIAGCAGQVVTQNEVYQKVFSNLNTIATNYSIPIRNIGQGNHLLVITGTGCTTVQMKDQVYGFLQASYDGSTYFNISDKLKTSYSLSAKVTGIGTYPYIRAGVVLTGNNCTVNTYYSGSKTPFGATPSLDLMNTQQFISSGSGITTGSLGGTYAVHGVAIANTDTVARYTGNLYCFDPNAQSHYIFQKMIIPAGSTLVLPVSPQRLGICNDFVSFTEEPAAATKIVYTLFLKEYTEY